MSNILKRGESQFFKYVCIKRVNPHVKFKNRQVYPIVIEIRVVAMNFWI